MSAARRRPPPAVADDNPPSPPAGQPQEDAEQLASKLATELLASKPAGELTAVELRDQILAGMAQLRQKPVDPMTDYVKDGTRQLAWVQDTIQTQAFMTNKKQQELVRDVMLGEDRLDPALLDSSYLARYQRPRPRPQPETEDV